MASEVLAYSTALAQQLSLVKAQADTALTQQQAAEKAMACCAEHLRKNPTPENSKKFKEIVTQTLAINNKAADLRRQVNELELAYLKLSDPSSSGSLADKQVVELDLEGPVGYFPTK